MIIVHPPNIAQEARRVGPTLNGEIQEIAVWNLDGVEGDKKASWLPALIAIVPVALLLGYFAKGSRR